MSIRDRFEGLDLAADFCRAWLKAGGTPAELNSLREDPHLLAEIARIANGTSEDFRYRIDCDADPRSGEYAVVMNHSRQGMLEWHPKCVRLLTAEKELGRQRLRDGIPLGEWSHENAANACLLDFFLRRPGIWRKMVPPSFDRRYIFAGTKYKSPPGGGCAGFEGYRVIQNDSHGWGVRIMGLNNHLHPKDVLVVLSPS